MDTDPQTQQVFSLLLVVGNLVGFLIIVIYFGVKEFIQFSNKMFSILFRTGLRHFVRKGMMLL